MQKQLAEMDGENLAISAKVFAGLCAKELARLESEPPRLYDSWREVREIFKEVGADELTYDTVETFRLKALERHQAIRERHDGAPKPIKLEGWIDQALQSVSPQLGES